MAGKARLVMVRFGFVRSVMVWFGRLKEKENKHGLSVER